MKKNEKLIVYDRLKHYFYWGGFVTIEELEEDTKKVKELGGNGIMFENYGESSIEIQVTNERLETEEEYSTRQTAIKLREKRQQEQDLETLKRLKEKYEK